MTDIVPAERTRHIERIEPTDTRKAMPNEEFVKSFEQPWRFPNRAAVVVHELYSQTIFCIACLEERPNGSVNAFRMFVEREKDLLGNFPAIITLTCMGCGASERAPSKIPANEEQPTYEQLYEEWRKARNDRVRMAEMNAQRQQMKAAQMAAAYGQGSAQLQQQMQGMQAAIESMVGLGPIFAGVGGPPMQPKIDIAKVKLEGPLPAVESRLGREIEMLHEMERHGAPDGMVAKMRKRIVDMLGYLP